MISGAEQYYDDLYGEMGKDYSVEAKKIHTFIQKHKRSRGNTLLDVACGTGLHVSLLSEHYQVQGTDINAGMLKVARKKHPEFRFTQGDMRSFQLRQKFDVITCLFSAIGYMTTKADLQNAIKNMSNHLLPGGILLVEPWFTPEQWTGGRVGIICVDKPDIKVVRMSRSEKGKKVSPLSFHYLISTSKGIKHIVEEHNMGLFTHEEYLNTFTKSGLSVTHNPEGVYGRGLYIGTKPS
jgi:ubiquinone/menaquinone biosynthesis C-methylase UbiE